MTVVTIVTLVIAATEHMYSNKYVHQYISTKVPKYLSAKGVVGVVVVVVVMMVVVVCVVCVCERMTHHMLPVSVCIPRTLFRHSR